jgi:hypothetical protein
MRGSESRNVRGIWGVYTSDLSCTSFRIPLLSQWLLTLHSQYDFTAVYNITLRFEGVSPCPHQLLYEPHAQSIYFCRRTRQKQR